METIERIKNGETQLRVQPVGWSEELKVLGTEFNVSAYSGIEEFNIALLRGSVELNSSDRSGKYRMKAGEQIFYREGKYVSAQIGNMDYFKWKEGVLSFNNQPIHVIITLVL